MGLCFPGDYDKHFVRIQAATVKICILLKDEAWKVLFMREKGRNSNSINMKKKGTFGEILKVFFCICLKSRVFDSIILLLTFYVKRNILGIRRNLI